MTTVRHDTRAAALRSPAPRRRDETAAPSRPPLRVVRTAELTARGRRRRARLLLICGLSVVSTLLLGMVAFQVVLTQDQARLEELERKAATEQDRYERLRLEVAQLESPGRVVAAAQERLGMVPPATVTYLSPQGATGEDGPDRRSGFAADAGPPASPPATSDWSQVKPHLAARP